MSRRALEERVVVGPFGLISDKESGRIRYPGTGEFVAGATILIAALLAAGMAFA